MVFDGVLVCVCVCVSGACATATAGVDEESQVEVVFEKTGMGDMFVVVDFDVRWGLF